MSDPRDVKVTVTSFGPGRCLALRYRDPLSGKRVAESTGTRDPEEAAQIAHKREDELRTVGRTPAWADFTIAYTDQVLSGLAVKTRSQVATVFRTVERRLPAVKRLSDLTAARLSCLAAEMRGDGRSQFTIRNYLAHLKAALRWAVDVGMLAAVPKFPKIARVKGKKMKGRPITAEEFDRMLAAVASVVGEQSAKSWRLLLRGLWCSGFRLGEALNLTWDQPDKLRVVLTEKRPLVEIPGAKQKSGKDQLWPMPPELWDLLSVVPESRRRGRVFKLAGVVNPRSPWAGSRGGSIGHVDWVSHVVSRMGKKAGIKVESKQKRNPQTGVLEEWVKYASAHDLRRSFGVRWSKLLMPTQLRELMRHADISTTMQFYVGHNAQSTADAAWEAYERAAGNTSGNAQPGPSSAAPIDPTQSVIPQGLSEAHLTGLEPVTFGSVDRCSIQLS